MNLVNKPRRKTVSEPINSILLIQLAGMGDLVMATPTIRAIREKFPDAYIVLLTTERAKDLLKNSKHLDRIFSLDYTGRFQSGLLFNQKNWRTISELRKHKFDLAANLYQIYSFKGALRLWLLFKLINIKFIVGRNTEGRGFFLDLKIKETAIGDEHEVESNLRLAESIGARAINKKLHLEINEEDAKFISELLFGYNVSDKDLLIGINPGSAWRLTRRWLPERFAQTADEIVNKYSAKIVFTGSMGEARLSDEIISLMKNKPINTTGKLNVPQLAALIKRCNLYISVDSGPMHIAVAVKTPLVAICGAGPERYFPYGNSNEITIIKKNINCGPCYKIKCNDHRCMRLISVEDVLEAADNQLKKSGLI